MQKAYDWPRMSLHNLGITLMSYIRAHSLRNVHSKPLLINLKSQANLSQNLSPFLFCFVQLSNQIKIKPFTFPLILLFIFIGTKNEATYSRPHSSSTPATEKTDAKNGEREREKNQTNKLQTPTFLFSCGKPK